MSDLIVQQLEAALARIPYAQTLGVSCETRGAEVLLVLPFIQNNIGNPMLPALHGGAIGGFMEMTAICQLMIERAKLDGGGMTFQDSSMASLPKPIGINIDYLRPGRPVKTFAHATVFKAGKRISNVRVETWQDDRDKPIAAFHGHFLNAANA